MDRLSARHDQGGIAPTGLIGREPEIAQLRLLLGQIAQGAGDALLLSGDPGVGKTSLLGAAAALAADSGVRLLRATGSQFEADMQRAAKEQPLLLVIDDLPWLDRASALVLGMVARRLTGLPVGLLAACRTGEPNFFEQGNLPVARVEPLSDEAATQLLASRYPVMTSRVRSRLLDTARGNPLALLELPVSLGDLAQAVAGRLPAALPLSRRLLRGSLNVPFDSARPDALLCASRDRGRGGHRRLAGATFAELSANSPWCWR